MLLNHADSDLCGDEDCCHPCTEAHQPVSVVTAMIVMLLEIGGF